MIYIFNLFLEVFLHIFIILTNNISKEVKNVKKMILCFVVLLLSACSNTSTQSSNTQTFQDGTYTATASGYGGQFQVEVILQNDQIKDILVKEHNETPSIGGVALEQMIDKMKKNNKYDVDTISGATKTSQALKNAVMSAMEKAKNKTE